MKQKKLHLPCLHGLNMLKKRVSKMVKLRPYHTLLFSDLEKFTLLEEDRKFTKTPLENIDLANRDQERHPTLVYDDKDRCVGFLRYMKVKGSNLILQTQMQYFLDLLVWIVNIEDSGTVKRLWKHCLNISSGIIRRSMKFI